MHILKRSGKVFSFFCSIGLFLIFITIMIITTTHNLVTKDNLAKYIEDANVMDMEVNSLLDLKEEGDNITLKDKITNMALDIGIPKEVVKDILASDELNLLLGEFFSRAIDYVLDGKEKPTLSADIQNKMIDLALESSANHINVILDDDTLTEYIKEYTIQIGKMIPDRLDIFENESIYNYLNDVLNFNSIYLYILIIILSILIGIFTWNVYKPIQYLAISMTVAGIIFTIIGSADGLLNKFITSKIDGMEAFISPLVTNILTLWFKCGVIVSFAGVFLLVIYAVIARIVKHNNIKKLEL